MTHASSLRQSANVRLWADRLGTWTSALCVVHCVLTPFILSTAPFVTHLLPGDEATHRFLAVLVASCGGLALLSGFRRHRRWRVLGCLFAGLLCIFVTAWRGDSLPSHACEVLITLCGSSLLIAAHRMNHTFCGTCVCTGCEIDGPRVR